MVINAGITYGGVNTQAYGYGQIFKGYTGSAYDVQLINPGYAADSLTIQGGIRLQSTTSPFVAPSMTTTQRDAMIASVKVAGSIIYNTTIGILQGYNGSTWNNLW